MLTLFCSVGKAPIPTLVVYAFTTPYTSPTFCGGMPRPVQTPPTVQFDEVTKGYVPMKKKWGEGDVLKSLFKTSFKNY